MQADRILFPTDFSEASKLCMIQASALARDAGARLLILHVDETDDAPSAIAGISAEYPRAPGLMEALLSFLPTLDDVTYEHHLVTGLPAKEIVRVAAEQGVDLIVMSTHGRTGTQRLLLGSVAEAVVRCAPCPVLTLRPQPTDDAE